MVSKGICSGRGVGVESLDCWFEVFLICDLFRVRVSFSCFVRVRVFFRGL